MTNHSKDQDMRTNHKTTNVFACGSVFLTPDWRFSGVYGFPDLTVSNFPSTDRNFISAVQSNLFNTDTKGTEPSVRFTEVSVL